MTENPPRVSKQSPAVMTSPVLLLGAEPRIAAAVARSLHRHAIPVDVAVLGNDEPVFSSRAIRQFLRFPPPFTVPCEFLQRMQETIRVHSYDVLIPCSDSTLVACSSYYQELSRLLHVACPRPEVTQRILNKLSTLQIAEQCGIRTPKTYSLFSLRDLEALRHTLHFPLIAKPKEKLRAGSFKTRRFEIYDELWKMFLENPEFGLQNLIQECCIGVGLGIEVLLHRGNVIASFQHRRLKELPAAGGVSVLAIAEELDSRLLDQSIRLLRALEWEGVAMVEFLFDPSAGAATLMEVNGRFWGSLPLAVQAGVDFPFWYWQVIHGQTPDVSRPYRRGLRSRWLCGDFLRLHGLFFPASPATFSPRYKWRELFRFISDFRPSTREMIWSWKDPAPAIAEFTRELRHLVATPVKRLGRRVMPASLNRWLLIRRRLGPKAASIYQKRQIARALGLIRDRSRHLPVEIRTILFVCRGNIIRSAMGAALLRKFVGDISPLNIISAGLFAKVGTPADPRANTAATNYGISLDQHRAQLIQSETAERADLILVMDFQNESVLLSRFPTLHAKTFLLGAFPFENCPSSIEISDPYDGDAAEVQRCFEILNGHVRKLASLLSAEN